MRAYLVTLQDAAVATGNGTAMLATGYASIAYQVSGTFVGTVTFEGTVDNTNWVAIQAVNTATGAVSTTATAGGVYVANVAGLSQARARVTWTSGTSVTVKGQAVDTGSLNLADVDVSVSGGAITKTAGTGSAAIATSAALTADARLVSVTVHFDIAPTTAGSLTVKLNATAGAAYDTLLYSVDPSVGSVTDIVYVPDESLYLVSGDAIDVAYTNANTRTYGVQITTEAV